MVKVKNSTNGATSNSFEALIERFNHLAMLDNNTDEYAKTLQSLSIACTASVLKKCYDVSGSSVMLDIRRDTQRFKGYVDNRTDLDTLDSADVYTLSYNSDGEEVRTVNRDYDRRISSTVEFTLGDGADMVQEATIAILSELDKQREREQGEPIDLERPYTVRRLKKRVRIKSEDSKGGWETVETTPIQEVYRAIRRAVSESSSVQVASFVYTYIEDVITDPESGAEDRIYWRNGKFEDVGADTVFGYSANQSDVEFVENIERKLRERLNEKQEFIFDLRLKRYGKKAIATKMGIPVNSVQSVYRDIRRKSIEIGFKPPKGWNENQKPKD